jgi:hypothetical protein
MPKDPCEICYSNKIENTISYGYCGIKSKFVCQECFDEFDGELGDDD